MILSKINRIINLSKQLALFSFVLLLFCNQVNALPTLATLGEKHDVSVISNNGQFFLKLGHNHSHKSHHQEKLSTHFHSKRAASIFNGHDGAHKDHLIRISDSIENLSSTQSFAKILFDSSIALEQISYKPNNKLYDLSKNFKYIQRIQLPQDQSFIKYSVKFLV